MFLKNISLIGFMGSGKSTIGKILAQSLNYLFIDTDKIIEYICGLTINEIFKNKGEGYFRAEEKELISKVYYNQNCVFSCGGGSFNNLETIQVIRENSCVIYLSMTEEEAYERLKNVKDRPLLSVKGDLKQKISDIMDKRKDIYKNNCDLEIKIENKTPQKIKDEIMSFVNLH